MLTFDDKHKTQSTAEDDKNVISLAGIWPLNSHSCGLTNRQCCLWTHPAGMALINSVVQTFMLSAG